MIPTSDGLTIELRINNRLYYNYFRMGLYALMAGGVVFFLLTWLVSLALPVRVLISVAGMIGAMIIQFYLAQKFLNYLQGLYTRVIHRIEELAMP